MLLRQGADPYLADDAGRGFLHMAIDGNLKTASKLGDTPRRIDDLRNFLVVCNNHFLDFNRPDNDGMTALHYAAKFGYAHAAAALIEAGADPHAKDHRNHTPRDLANANKRHEASAVLGAVRAREAILETVRRAGVHLGANPACGE
jgi:ankyrin repeat protein